jgi:uncharacterized protein
VLIQFSVRNYRSIRNTVTLDFVASRIKSKDSRVDEKNVFTFNKLRILKSIGLYGANASGKSNVIKALIFMQDFIRNSSSKLQIGDEISVEPFLLDQTSEAQNSTFEIIFVAKNYRYRYGFEVNKSSVAAEWLYWTPKFQERKVFYREDDKVSFGDGDKDLAKLTRFMRSNSLFISTAAQFNAEHPTEVIKFIGNVVFLHGVENSMRSLSVDLLDRKLMTDEINTFLRSMDVSIEKFVLGEKPIVQDTKDEKLRLVNRYMAYSKQKVLTIHNKYDEDGKIVGLQSLDLEENESGGTQKLFSLAGMVLATLVGGGILVVDELDSQLHPLITLSIIRMFNSNTQNISNAQLLFVTHDTNLLDSKIFRRDQIWFTEKNNMESTEIYSLGDYVEGGKKVRYDASFEKDYIAGKYGAIPYLGSFNFPTD